MEIPSNAFPDLQLPRGVFHYAVDVLTREPATLEIDGGDTSGQYRDVILRIAQRDVSKGRTDVADMIIWGDVDPNFHPRIATLLANSAPITFTPVIPIVLSAGAGLKTINVRIVFMSGRYADSSITYTLGADVAHVSILRQPFREALNSTHTVKLAWSCSHDVSFVRVCLADTYDAPRSSCAQVVTGTNVNTGGSWAAGTMIESSFVYADALAASAGLSQPLDVSGQAFVKIFATTSLGETS